MRHEADQIDFQVSLLRLITPVDSDAHAQVAVEKLQFLRYSVPQAVPAAVPAS